jgi:uncharacterized membrane protein YeaQ/YmgE (transglycosylase-associated protein family)
VTTQAPKIKSKWWYLLPIFLGVIGGIIAWVTLKSFDRKMAKNCLILGVILDVIGIMILVGLVLPSDNFNLVTEFETISETSDFDFQFQIKTP